MLTAEESLGGMVVVVGGNQGRWQCLGSSVMCPVQTVT